MRIRSSVREVGLLSCRRANSATVGFVPAHPLTLCVRNSLSAGEATGRCRRLRRHRRACAALCRRGWCTEPCKVLLLRERYRLSYFERCWRTSCRQDSGRRGTQQGSPDDRIVGRGTSRCEACTESFAAPFCAFSSQHSRRSHVQARAEELFALIDCLHARRLCVQKFSEFLGKALIVAGSRCTWRCTNCEIFPWVDSSACVEWGGHGCLRRRSWIIHRHRTRAAPLATAVRTVIIRMSLVLPGAVPVVRTPATVFIIVVNAGAPLLSFAVTIAPIAVLPRRAAAPAVRPVMLARNGRLHSPLRLMRLEVRSRRKRRRVAAAILSVPSLPPRAPRSAVVAMPLPSGVLCGSSYHAQVEGLATDVLEPPKTQTDED